MPTTPMPIVRLWEHAGTALIIRWPSGVRYVNQICGTACAVGSLEGVLVPIANDTDVGEDGGLARLWGPADALYQYFIGPAHLGAGAQGGLTEDDARFVEGCLHEHPNLRCITVDRERLRESCEAWVFVILAEPDESSPLFAGFGPFPLSGVLTWENSD